MWLAYVLRWKAWDVESVADREGGEVVSGNLQRSWNRIHNKEIRPCFFFTALRRNFLLVFFYFKINSFFFFFFVFCSFRIYKRRKMRDFQKNKNCYNHKKNRIIIFWLEYKKIFFKQRKNNENIKKFCRYLNCCQLGFGLSFLHSVLLLLFIFLVL